MSASRRKLKVVLAQPRGFCTGVVRAIAIVEAALAKYGPPIFVRHEIVHNKHVVESLRAKGVRFVSDLSEVPANSITVLSAHGVSRAVEADARMRGLPTLDATCPLVSKVHRHSKRYVAKGRSLIVIGHKNHPEVEGTLGQIDGPVILVENEADVAQIALPNDTPVAYVTQTTLSVDDTKGIIAALAARFGDLVGPSTDDICYATQNRQNAVRELARHVELILVVGSPNSSNSNRLREVGELAGVTGYLIADGSQIDPDWLEGVSAVGVTAGASAPEVLVESVIEALRRHADVDLHLLPGVEERIEFPLPAELRDGLEPARAAL